MNPQPFAFGIYPGGIVGTPTGLSESKPDDAAKITGALEQLQGSQPTFLVRAYLHFTRRNAPGSAETPHPTNAVQYATGGRRLNLVLCFRDPEGDIAAWTEFVREKIRAHGERLASVSVTLEPNLALPNVAMDGNFPAIMPALVQGVAAARNEIASSELPVKLGFCATPSFGPKATFWPGLALAGGTDFAEALDYVGLDFYADVFYPVAADGEPGDLRGSVLHQLQQLRNVDLKAAGISSSTPIHVCENGWPTSSARSPERQAEVLEAVVRTIYGAREECNVTRYQWFALRDSDSSKDEIFSQFGLLLDDYTPKPAFERYRRLIAELGEGV